MKNRMPPRGLYVGIAPILLLIISLTSGCAHRISCAIIPVPTEDARSPEFALPLTDQTVTELTNDWLRYGLNPSQKYLKF